MKKLTFVLFLLAATQMSSASIYFDETFNYTTGATLATAAGWTGAGTIGTGLEPVINENPLVYSNSGGDYALSNTGKTVLQTYATGSTNYYVSKPFSATAVTSGVVYLSFLFSPNAVSQAQTGSAAIYLGGTTSGAQFWVGKGAISTSNFRFGVTRSSTSNSTVTWNSTEYTSDNTVYFIVLKYDFSTGAASIFVNPTIASASEPTPSATDNSVGTAPSSLQNVAFKMNGSNKNSNKIGAIRVSSSWSEAVAPKSTAPRLTTPIVGIATDITAEGFTANWTAVANAVGYDVKVYQGTTLISTTNVSGQPSANLAISGLLSGTIYTYKVVAKGNGIDFSDSALSDASTLFTTLGLSSVPKVTANFSDGTWGSPGTSNPVSGAYPSSSVNGFNFVKAVLLTGSATAPTGESFTNRVLLDKNTQGGAIEFPTLSTVGEIEIIAATGSEAMSFRLEEWVVDQWVLVGTYTTTKALTVYTIPLLRNSETKLRIANNTGSGLYVYKIESLTYQETTELTLRSSNPNQGNVIFSNLTKSFTLAFNKNVQKANGDILLNGVVIPLTSCTVTDNVVTIPVVLETTPGTNKSYTFTVSAGAFTELGNATNLSKAISINFQTLKSVAYPSNYTGLIDVVYKNVNSTNTRMDVYYPTNASTPVPVVINMHGGGWVGGFKEEQGGFNMYFNRGYALVNVEYRMRNEILAPAAVEDVRGAMHYVLNHAQEWNIDPQKIIFQGGSAGGHLALIGGYLQNNRIYDNECVQYTGDIKVMAVIDKYGAAELISFTPVYSGMVAWLGSRSTDETFIRSLSPVHWITPQTPPTFIIHGDADPTIPYSQSVVLQAALQSAGVKNSFTTVPNGLHGGFPTNYNTQFEADVLTFIDEVLTNITTVTIPKKSLDNTKIQIKNNTITINSEDNIETKVYNALGNEIYATNANTFHISTKGFYIVKMAINNRITITKILIN